MGQLVIPSGSKVYIDTSVLIYTLEVNRDYFSLLQPLWIKFQTGEIELISSELILMEVLVLPLRNNNESLVSDYEQLLLNSAMQLVPIEQSILRQAANLRATNSLKTPDLFMLRLQYLLTAIFLLLTIKAFVIYLTYL
jgi:predicted nucleic acid-binding protein